LLTPEFDARVPADGSPDLGPSSKPTLNVCALIPALNEEDALPGAVSGLMRAGVKRVVVVDNGSTDDTANVALASGAEVVTEPKRGYGAACLAGIAYLAATQPPEVVVFMDGDQSDDPSAIGRLLEPIRTGRADFVVGVRGGVGSEGRNAIPAHARLGNALIISAARLLHGTRFRDLGPFRAIRFDVLRSLQMDDRDWGWTLQMQLRAYHHGVATEEVAVPHRERAEGRSKVSGTISGSLRAGVKMVFTLVRERIRPTRVPAITS
jgi:glycosyltransferase involved in cell wall biosynthesis